MKLTRRIFLRGVAKAAVAVPVIAAVGLPKSIPLIKQEIGVIEGFKFYEPNWVRYANLTPTITYFELESRGAVINRM